MNPGYLTFVSVTCFAILAFSGWNKALCGEVPLRKVALLLAAWLLALPLDWRFAAGVVVNGSAVVALLVSAVSVWRMGFGRLFAQTLAAAALILVWHALAGHLHDMGVLRLSWSGVDIAAGEAAIAGIALRQTAAQFTALLWGLAAGEGWEQTLVGRQLHIGGASFWDGWWPAFLLARTASAGMEWLGAGMRRLAGRMK